MQGHHPSEHLTESQHQQAYPQLTSPKLYHSISLPTNPIQQSSIGADNPNATKLHEIFNIPDLKINKLYQKSVRQVIELMGQFDKFTQHMEAKVDALLAAQQNQFVDSYKTHMKSVENQFKLLEQEVNRQKQLIKYYENQGKMSNLVKKVVMLEQESKKLYEIINKRDKQIKSLQLEVKVQKQENKRLYAQTKQLLKNRNKNQTMKQKHQSSQQQDNHRESTNKTLSHIKIEHSSQHNHEELNFFTTQIGEQRSLKKDLSITTDDRKDKKMASITYNLSQKSMILPQQPQYHDMRLKKELTNITNKNRRLAKFNSKILEERNQLQNIFINSVAEIKRQIQVKKKIRYCSYEDFAKQDKISLLLTIVSNEQILKYVYEKIFGTKDILPKQNSTIRPGFNDKLPLMTTNSKSMNKKIGLPLI